jgi:glycosyltransferase involved in cell wall biosynthesis
MPESASQSELSLVSVVLTTHDRPQLFAVALACYQQQTYPRRELIVVDDGATCPVDAAAVAAVGGRLIRLAPGTPLGVKLNRGVQAGQGRLCMKMDDDDWYGPAYLETMVSALRAHSSVVCRPTIAFLCEFLFFDVVRWEVRWSTDLNAPGATLLFAREDWQVRPFRPLSQHEDMWFISDQVRAGIVPLAVQAPETFLAVRHRGSRVNRGHTWTHQRNGQPLEGYVRDRPLYKPGPEGLLPPWALAVYREIHDELVAHGAGESC